MQLPKTEDDLRSLIVRVLHRELGDLDLRGANLTDAIVTRADFRRTVGLRPTQRADLKRRGAIVDELRALDGVIDRCD